MQALAVISLELHSVFFTSRAPAIKAVNPPLRYSKEIPLDEARRR
jgi:hypothetical protein